MTLKEFEAIGYALAPTVRDIVTKAVQAAVEPVWLENRRLEMRVLELETRPAVVGPAGPQGEQGEPGRDGIDGIGLRGSDGLNGRDGLDGKDGAAGVNGKDGADGLDGKDGAAGVNGKDGADAIMDSALLETLASYAKRLHTVEGKTLLSDRIEADVKRLTQRISAVESDINRGDDLAPDEATALFVETLTAAMKAASPIQ